MHIHNHDVSPSHLRDSQGQRPRCTVGIFSFLFISHSHTHTHTLTDECSLSRQTYVIHGSYSIDRLILSVKSPLVREIWLGYVKQNSVSIAVLDLISFRSLLSCFSRCKEKEEQAQRYCLALFVFCFSFLVLSLTISAASLHCLLLYQFRFSI